MKLPILLYLSSFVAMAIMFTPYVLIVPALYALILGPFVHAVLREDKKHASQKTT